MEKELENIESVENSQLENEENSKVALEKPEITEEKNEKTEEKPLTKKEKKEIKQRAKDAKLRRNFKKLFPLSIVMFSIATITVIALIIMASIFLNGEGSYEYKTATYRLILTVGLLSSLVLYIPSSSASSLCLYDQYKNKKHKEKFKKALLWLLTILPLVIEIALIIMIAIK